VQEAFGRGIDGDFGDLGDNRPHQNQHYNHRFYTVAAHEMGKIFKSLFYPIS
jgi:hypothetical protein